MDASETGKRLIESFEGYSFRAYWDSFGRVWTVGYGETSGVNKNTTMTRAQAETDLSNRLKREYEPAINAIGGQHWNQNQFDSWCSIAWNLGPGATRWDIGRYAQEGNWLACAHALLKYDRAGGAVLGGLVTRRKEEAALMLKPPPPPPDPMHYLWYPDVLFSLGQKTIIIQGVTYTEPPNRISERELVMSYDRMRAFAHQNAHELNQMRVRLVQLRDRCWTVAHFTDPVAWNDSRHLGFRWQELDKRAKGELVHPG